MPAGETEMSFLRHITDAGARDRYRPYHDKARAQIARELDLIEKLDLAGYFLIVWDIVNYCRQQDILVQGRGSAANSAVCYSLGITAVDPIAMDLLFERFLSEERGEWPDIDLDLAERRSPRARHPARLREIRPAGRGDDRQRDHLSRPQRRPRSRQGALARRRDRSARQGDEPLRVHRSERDAGRNLESVGLSLDMPRMRTFAELWVRIQDLPRHLGQHSGGMVICQGALDSVVPLEPASMPGRVVMQWDKDDCADMGIVKVDLLGLGMMAVLQDAIELVNTTGVGGDRETQSTGSGLQSTADPGASPDSISPIFPPDDPDVYELLQKADTIGVFQVESRAQMATLPRLKPTLLRPRRGGGDHPPRADRRRHGASVSESPRGTRAGGAAASVARAGARAHAGRAALSGAAAADGDGGRRLHRRSGRGAAPRHGVQALRRSG